MNDFYYSENPQSDVKEKNFTETYRNKTLLLTSVSGVFSFEKRIDRASRLIIESFKPSGDTVLDIGCGYGAIGLFIQSLYPQLFVTMTDINARAVKYAKKNAEQNKLWVKVIKSNLYEGLGNEKFWDIVTNPPVAAGKKTIIQLIEDARKYLHPGGSLWLVAFHNKGGARFKKIMREKFNHVEDIEKKGGIRVYRSVFRYFE